MSGFTSQYLKGLGSGKDFPTREFAVASDFRNLFTFVDSTWFWSLMKAHMKNYMNSKIGIKPKRMVVQFGFPQPWHCPLRVHFYTSHVAGDCYFQVLKTAACFSNLCFLSSSSLRPPKIQTIWWLMLSEKSLENEFQLCVVVQINQPLEGGGYNASVYKDSSDSTLRSMWSWVRVGQSRNCSRCI